MILIDKEDKWLLDAYTFYIAIFGKINKNGHHKYLGSFDNPKDAHQAYLNARDRAE